MAKTVSFTLENPITSLRKMVAKRAISKSEKRIAKEQEKIQKLQNKFFKSSEQKKSSDEVTEVTKELEQITERMTTDKVVEKFGNKIKFEKNTKNNFYHADKGMIDGKFIEFAKTTKWLNVSPNPKNSNEDRVFFNHTSNGQKALFKKQALAKGWEIEFPA